jgi:hypothetical protein
MPTGNVTEYFDDLIVKPEDFFESAASPNQTMPSTSFASLDHLRAAGQQTWTRITFVSGPRGC